MAVLTNEDDKPPQTTEELLSSYYYGGYELFEATEEKNFKGKLQLGWYWLAFNSPRAGFWFVGAFATKQEAEEDALKKAIPMDDPRRENDIFDGVLPEAQVKYAFGKRGTIDSPIAEGSLPPRREGT
jgi:hypothetical protein